MQDFLNQKNIIQSLERLCLKIGTVFYIIKQKFNKY